MSAGESLTSQKSCRGEDRYPDSNARRFILVNATGRGRTGLAPQGASSMLSLPELPASTLKHATDLGKQPLQRRRREGGGGGVSSAWKTNMFAHLSRRWSERLWRRTAATRLLLQPQPIAVCEDSSHHLLLSFSSAPCKITFLWLVFHLVSLCGSHSLS